MEPSKLNELKKKVLKSEAPAKIKLAAVKALDARCNASEEPYTEETIRWQQKCDRQIKDTRLKVQSLLEIFNYANVEDLEELDDLKRLSADLENAKKDVDKLIRVFK